MAPPMIAPYGPARQSPVITPARAPRAILILAGPGFGSGSGYSIKGFNNEMCVDDILLPKYLVLPQ